MARIDTLNNFLTDVADSIREKKGTTDKISASDFDTEIQSIQSGGGEPEKKYTGSFDREGLKELGYTDEEIDYYNQFVYWDKEDDEKHKITDDEMAISKKTTYSTLSSSRLKVIWLPTIKITASNVNNLFKNFKCLKTIPLIDTSKSTTFSSTFGDCYNLETIPLINTSKATVFSGMFSGCYTLKEIPEIDTSNATNMDSMFYFCTSLKKVPTLNTEKVVSANSMFNYCQSVKDLSNLTFKNLTSANTMFSYCQTLEKLPNVDFSKIKSFYSMFSYCQSIKKIDNLDTKSATTFSYCFSTCRNLEELCELDASNVTSINESLSTCPSLRTFGGFKNIGQAYSTTTNANYTNMTISVYECYALTHQSLMNIINNLYDIKSKGCNIQGLRLGTINMAKLTAEEIAIATDKGWNVY